MPSVSEPTVSVGSDTMKTGTISTDNNYTTQSKGEANKRSTNGVVSLGTGTANVKETRPTNTTSGGATD